MGHAAPKFLSLLLALGLALAACSPGPRGVEVVVTRPAPPLDEPAPAATLMRPNMVQTILPPTVTRVITPTATPKKIAVFVNGAVARPGVYTFADEARVVDALQAAGGLLDTAEADGLNQAAPLRDGQQIYVPFRGTPAPPSIQSNVAPQSAPTQPASKAAVPAVRGPININTASKEELDTLPGIGPVLAERIIDYRQKNGPFQRPEDIKKVTGIADKVFTDIKDMITAP